MLRKRQQSITGDTSQPSISVSEQLVSDITLALMSESAMRNRSLIQSVGSMTSSIPTRTQVCEKFSLNADQAQAYYIICRHLDGESHLDQGKKRIALYFLIDDLFSRGTTTAVDHVCSWIRWNRQISSY